MKLVSSDFVLLSQCAISAAYQAGKVISENSNTPVTVNTKKAGESLASQVVTEVDLLAQQLILQRLLPTCERYDLALLTEESPDDFQRLKKDFFWCIDPLDGTLPFVESTAGYSVSIALVCSDGTPYIGVIYDPVEQTLYSAIKGHGALRNGKPWAWKSNLALSEQSLTFISDRSFKQHHLFDQTLTELENIATKLGYCGVNNILYGGAVMNASWVLEKNPACYFKFPKPETGGGSLWDYAATACLFAEAGAVVSDIQGRPLDLNRPDSSFMNHRGVLYSSHHEIAEQVINLYHNLMG